MVAPVRITQSVVALKRPISAEVDVGALAVNVTDGALYSKRKDDTIIRIEGDVGNDAIAGASSIALGAVVGGVVDVAGVAMINAIVLREGQTRTVRFTGASQLVHSAALQLVGGANITTAAGDFASFRGYAAGVTRCMYYSFGTPPALSVASVNKVQITAPAVSAVLTIASGKTLSAENTITLRGTDGAALNVGGGGTLGSAAFTASSAYQPARVAYALAPAATDLASVITLANNLRALAVYHGLGL
ncbi:hypothetical protein [Massilia sp. DWR3-1-1]|uniref:hypothetical protein n=1 Tax=Massilia sp. DWR3-1-1 TaxID=2804559 RepID=UPI003CF42DE3